MAKGWDGQQLQKDIDAQVAITQKFSEIAPKQIANFANDRMQELKDKGASAEEIAKWDEGGVYRVALHTVSGGLTGGLSGAVGAGSVAGSAKTLDKLQTNVGMALVDRGMSVEAAAAISSALAQATAAGIGAALSGNSGAATALATDTNNRQLHSSEWKLIEEIAKAKAEENCKGRGSECIQRFEIAITDALQRTAKGLVDDKASEENAEYIRELELASSNPHSEGARGALSDYINSLHDAEKMLSQYFGQQIYVRGVASSSGGDPLTYFQATPAQKADSFLGTLLGNTQPSIIPGMELRDENRVDFFGVLNGSILKDYTVEEVVLGDRVARAISGLLGKGYNSLLRKKSTSGDVAAKPVVEYAGGSQTLPSGAQEYVPDLSHVTGKGAVVRNKAIDSIIKEDLPNLNFTYIPEYSPFIRTGIAQRGAGTQIGKTNFSSRDALRDVIIHEELHHRWWAQGIINHHSDATKDVRFYEVIDRYKRMRGWNE